MNKQRFMIEIHNRKIIGISDELDDYDAYIKINGNFETEELKQKYYESVCDILNNNVNKLYFDMVG